MPKKFNKKKEKETNGNVHKMSLGEFKAVMWPTCLPVRLVYGDDRAITASSSQADYVYRANSLFDCDLTGVGGQPQGFDQLKTLYTQYRVIAVGVEAWAFANAADGNGGVLVVAPSNESTSYVSAEEVAGLRYAKSAMFTQATPAHVKALYHIGDLLGYSDDAVLANPSLAADKAANPSLQNFIHVAVEVNGGATNVTVVFTKLTYYARMEFPIAVIDTVTMRQHRAAAGLLSRTGEGAASSGDASLTAGGATSTAGENQCREVALQSPASGASAPSAAANISSSCLCLQRR